MPDEPPAEFLSEWLRENSDAQPLTARCALCPDWEATGTVKEAREAALAHRQEHHPEMIRTKQAHRANKKFARYITAEREQEIDEERRIRIRALGLTNATQQQLDENETSA